MKKCRMYPMTTVTYPRIGDIALYEMKISKMWYSKSPFFDLRIDYARWLDLIEKSLTSQP